jgi:hypothetical protein
MARSQTILTLPANSNQRFADSFDPVARCATSNDEIAVLAFAEANVKSS